MTVKLPESNLYWTTNRELWVSEIAPIISVYARYGDSSGPTNWGTAHERERGDLIHILKDYNVTINSFNNGVFAVFKNTRFMPKKIRSFLDFFSKTDDE